MYKTAQQLGNLLTQLHCTNPIQSSTTVSQQFTVKNIEAYFNFDVAEQSNAHNLECLTAYIMFVPQGMNVRILMKNNIQNILWQ